MKVVSLLLYRYSYLHAKSDKHMFTDLEQNVILKYSLGLAECVIRTIPLETLNKT